MARIGVVLMPFPYAENGVDTEQLEVNCERSFGDEIFKGLEAAGFIREANCAGGAESDLNRRVVAAFDQHLAGMGDEDLLRIVARGGADPETSREGLLRQAKVQIVVEMERSAAANICPLTDRDALAPSTEETPGDQRGEQREMKAVHRGGGAYSIVDGSDPVELNAHLSKDEAKHFNGLSTEEKLAFIADRRPS